VRLRPEPSAVHRDRGRGRAGEASLGPRVFGLDEQVQGDWRSAIGFHAFVDGDRRRRNTPARGRDGGGDSQNEKRSC